MVLSLNILDCLDDPLPRATAARVLDVPAPEIIRLLDAFERFVLS